MIETLREKLETQFPAVVEELCDIIRIPSVSSGTFDQEKVWESARHVEARFKALGLTTQILNAPAENGEAGRPAVVAQTKKIEGAPTVLLYAHHDVQPAGDESRWITQPFEPSVRDGRLYGRGSSDDGAGIVVHWGALNLLGEDLPLNVTVFIEGEEEIGSPSFNNFLSQYHELLEADYIVVADSDNWQVGAPALTSSLRGVVDVEVHVQVLEHALHSGMFGGPILDAVTLASRLIATFHDANGDVAVAGLGGSKVADVDWDEADFRRDSSLLDCVELTGTGDLASRMWTQPALAIIGFDATSVANSSNTIAPECRFKVSLRTVPGTDGRAAMDSLVAHINANIPFGAKVTVKEGEIGPSYQADLESKAARIAHQSLSDAWGVQSVNIGVGGSIPFISDFQREFPNAQVIVTGVEDPATNAHSENESQHLGDLQSAVLAEALMLLRFAD
ncbi:peptidase dimerization domain protein [Gleimia coleocanis DSM 15436]|uniref:Peptidase dimerization domain protein n=1 Tax=Gleimia coleocanis DSM 15436 TaxID=525245 RepID=C0W1V4_9ACTO|nr:dipeptidase [Gleimia coleocanis]EEH63470.1 peptidase dimerization domain protein [Gleimia coleocanis DSM 15436]